MVQGRYREGIPEEDRRKLVGCAFGGAIITAPFIALLYSRPIGLGVLALALGSMTFFAFDAYRRSPDAPRRNLLILAVVNTVFLALTICVLVWISVD